MDTERVRVAYSQGRVYFSKHLGQTPLDDAAEMLVVDIVVLAADSVLCTLFELVLSVTVQCERDRAIPEKQAHILTSESFDSAARTVLSSFD
jgi:hypothetical protein